MELTGGEYQALVAVLNPNQVVAVANERLRTINKLNSDIADWLLERRKLEEAYTIGLRKLARRTVPEASEELGVFELPWQRILAATESLAQSHETLASEIETDVERPLREFSTKNNEMKSMATIQNDLITLAKALETAQKKADKAAASRAGKSSSATAAVEQAKKNWSSRAPNAFEKLQTIDERRIHHLRDVLTQYQTHEADHVERNRQTAESSLNALLNIEAAEEIRDFALKKSGGRTVDFEPQQRNATPTPSVPSAPSMPVSPEPLPPPPKIHDDAASQHSSRSNKGRPSYQSPEPRNTPFGGLKRLGTVMSRRKSVISPSGGPSPPEKKFRSPFSAFRRADPSRSFHQMDDQPMPANGLHPITSREERPPTSAQDNVQMTQNSEPAPVAAPKTNGDVIPEEPTVVPEPPAENKGELEVIPQPSPKPQTDAEGYSERPDTIDEITRVQREAAATANDEAGLNLTIREQPIQEDEGEAKQALSEMASTLRKQAQQSGLSRGTGTLRGRRDVRNTIFIPNPAQDGPDNNALSPNLSSTAIPPVPPSPQPPPQPKAVASPNNNIEEQTLSDTTSIHSSHTLHSLSGNITHPPLPESGLNASIIEKLNVLISEGKVTRSYVVGEVALACNQTDTTPAANQVIRLDNFQVLERVAANPQFVTEKKSLPQNDGTATEEKKGLYDIQLSSIPGPFPKVGFKYQVHIDTSNLSSYCPVIFKPIWHEEEFQASVIIEYSVNPQFASTTPLPSVTLKNLHLTVGLDLSPVDETTKQPREVARATGAAMHPNTGASFKRKNSTVTWNIPEFEVTAGQGGKLLARFASATSWPRKGKVDAKFDAIVSDNSLRLGVSTPASEKEEAKEDDPFADDSVGSAAAASPEPKAAVSWKELPTHRRLTVARYVSH